MEAPVAPTVPFATADVPVVPLATVVLPAPALTIIMEKLPTTPDISLIDQCESIQYSFDIPMSIICCLSLIFGIIFSFFGYRCFKAVMFLVGFMFGAVVVLLICEEEGLLSTGANAGIAVGIGLLFGLITMLVQYIGLFMTGFQLGLLVGVSTLIILEQFYHPETFWFPVGITFGCGIVCALLTLQWQRSMVILSTSITGGSTVVICLDYFMEMFIMVRYVYDRLRAHDSIAVCWFSWLILAVWPIVAVVGIIVQIRVTGKEYDHKEVAKPRTRPAPKKRMELYKIRQQESRVMKQQRYRYLHQIRRYNGDILTPSYLQSVHDAMSPEVPEIMGTYQNLPPSPPPKGITNLPPLPDNFSDTTTDDNNRYSIGEDLPELNQISVQSKKFEDSHRTPSKLFDDSQRTPSKLFEDSHRTPSNLFDDSHRTKSKLLDDSHRTPSNLFDDNHRTPSNLFDDSHRTPSNLFDNSHRTPSNLFDDSHRTPSNLFDDSHRTPSNLFDDSHRTPSNLFEDSHRNLFEDSQSSHSSQFADSYRLSHNSRASRNSKRNSFLGEFTYVDENGDGLGEYTYVDDSTLPMDV